MAGVASEGTQKLLEEAARLADLSRELQDSASSFLSRVSTEEQSLRSRAAALDSDIRRISYSLQGISLDSDAADKVFAKFLVFACLGCYALTTEGPPTWIVKLNEELGRARNLITDGDVASVFPSKPTGGFLRAFLGPVNVHATRKDVRLKVKEEYNNQRDKTAFQFFLFPVILLFLRSWFWNGCFKSLAVQLYQVWLLFLYTSLALRENILRINGSDIRPWWVYHHYCSMFMALVSLTWNIRDHSDCPYRQRGVELFLYWAAMQGIAMLLQNRYQRQRLYTRIALGKARRMDVVWGETAAVEGQLLLLCPILFTLQGFEAYVGFLLLQTASNGATSEWQGLVCGAMLILMAFGNFIFTVETLVAKSRFKAKMKRSKHKKEMEH